MSQTKNILDGIKSRSPTAEEKISEPENIAIENIQNETKTREKKKGKTGNKS